MSLPSFYNGGNNTFGLDGIKSCLQNVYGAGGDGNGVNKTLSRFGNKQKYEMLIENWNGNLENLKHELESIKKLTDINVKLDDMKNLIDNAIPNALTTPFNTRFRPMYIQASAELDDRSEMSKATKQYSELQKKNQKFIKEANDEMNKIIKASKSSNVVKQPSSKSSWLKNPFKKSSFGRQPRVSKKRSTNKWIQGVTKSMKKKGTKGKFTAWCKRNGYDGVTSACINKGIARGGVTKKRAVLARTFRKISKGRKRSRFGLQETRNQMELRTLSKLLKEHPEDREKILNDFPDITLEMVKEYEKEVARKKRTPQESLKKQREEQENLVKRLSSSFGKKVSVKSVKHDIALLRRLH